jgi:hypothetical protein
MHAYTGSLHNPFHLYMYPPTLACKGCCVRFCTCHLTLHCFRFPRLCATRGDYIQKQQVNSKRDQNTQPAPSENLPFMLKIRAVIRFTNMQWMNRTRDLDFWKIWETYWNSNTLRSYWEHVPFTIGANIAPFHNTWYKCCSDVLWGLRKRRECICKNLKILWEFQQFALLLRTLSVYVAITSRARSDPITYVAKTCSARAQRMI